jgi:hypothetical protein
MARSAVSFRGGEVLAKLLMILPLELPATFTVPCGGVRLMFKLVEQSVLVIIIRTL